MSKSNKDTCHKNNDVAILLPTILDVTNELCDRYRF